jgi:siroheme synthase
MAAYRLLTTTTTTIAPQKDGTSGTVVIADRLVAAEILSLIDQRNGQLKVARKLPGCAELAQDENYWRIYQGLRDGKHVIRLKSATPLCVVRVAKKC